MPAALKPPVYTVEEASGGFAVCLDGKAFETPARKPLIVPTRPLAEAMVAEKPPRKGKFDPVRMPFMQLALTAIDIIAPAHDKTIDRIAAYAGSDLLCHRAEQPPALASEQEKIWQPLLDWCAQRFNAPLQNGKGIMPIKQPPESLQALRKAVAANDAFHLVGLDQAVGASGSLVLGLALITRYLPADAIAHAAELDAVHQMKQWGDDPAIQARIEATRRDLKLCESWVALLGGGQKTTA